MPKRTSPLDRINIDSPCSADWDDMIGNEQVRFCRHCSLFVHDLSKITGKDALKLVAASKGKLCVRYQRRPDGTLLTASHAQPLTHIKRRLSRLAAGAFTATLSIASSAVAQSPQTAERDPIARLMPAKVKDRAQPGNSTWKTASLTGTVLDPQDAVVAGAKITLTSEETQQEQSTQSDDEGAFRFDSVEAGNYTLRIESPGFLTYQKVNIALRSGDEQRINAKLDIASLGGAVIILPNTPLVAAIWNGNMTEVRNLLAEGVDVNVVDTSTDNTALGHAVLAGNLELVQTLLWAGADPNVRNNGGRTALMYLDDDATEEIVRALIGSGAKVNSKDTDGDTALLVAAALEKPGVLQALIDAGAKVNARNKVGKTALMVASEDGRLENVRALLLAGADVNQKDNDGATALSYARGEEGNEEIIATLLAYGAVE